MSSDRSTPGLAGSTARALRAGRGAQPSEAPEPPEPPEAEPTRSADDSAASEESSLEPATPEAAADEPAAVSAGASPDTDVEPPVLASRPSRKSRTAAPKAPRTTKLNRRPRSRLVVVTGVAAGAALVFAVISSVVWWRADHATARTLATTRDEVLVDARLAIATVNTSDYRKPDAALRNWLDASTGTLRSEFDDSRKQAVALLAQAKKITSATVLDAALTKLDTTKGSATVIASVNVTRKGTSGPATTTRNRFRATLTRVAGEWRLADLALVPVQLT